MTVYIDIDSLSYADAPAEHIAALTAIVLKGYANEESIAVMPQDRLKMLAQLVDGAGVTLLCGPSHMEYWKAVSHEVRLVIEPDSVEVTERVHGVEWGLRALGLKATLASRLADAPPKTAKHAKWEMYHKAVDAALELESAVSKTEPIIKEKHPVEILYEQEGLDAIANLAPCDEDHPVVLDYEWKKSDLSTVGLAMTVTGNLAGMEFERNVYIPVVGSDYAAPEGFGQQLRQAVWDLHGRDDVWIVWHNAKADLSTQAVADPLDLFGARVHDTIVMAYVAGYRELGLKKLMKMMHVDAMEYPGDLEDLPVELASRYAAAGDTKNTLDLYRFLRKKLVETGQWDVYNDIERPIIPVVASMEYEGQPVRVAELYRLKKEFEYILRGLEQHVWAKHKLNLADDKDQLEFATRMLGYNPGTVSSEKLAPLSEGPWLDTLIGYRKLRHRYRSFIVKHIERWKRAGYPSDFRGYSAFNQAGKADARDERAYTKAAATGRFTSSSIKLDGKDIGFGNLQNQPEDIRSAFGGPRGHRFFSYDFRSLEMVIAAAMSGDEALTEVLTEVCPTPGDDGCEHDPKHGDPHGQFQHACIALTGVDPGRTVAKNINYGANYGAGPATQQKTLAKKRVFIDFETAQLLDGAHREKYARYHEYNDEQQELAMARGYSETEYGRRRYDPDLKSPDFETRSAAARAAGNMPIQGTAADVVKRAMADVVPILKKYGAHMSMQIHDELDGWVHEDVAEDFDREMKAQLGSYTIRGMRLEIGGGVGDTWEEVH